MTTKQKKTIKVSDCVQLVNQLLSHSTCNSNIRQGYIVLLEEILHESGHSATYDFLTITEVPIGSKPGVWAAKDGVRFNGTDSTRRRYLL